MIRYESLDYSEPYLKKYSEFLSSVFSKSNPKSVDYLRWQYLENPAGKALGINAFDKDRLIGHYVTIPIKSMVDGKIQHGVFAIHAAVNSEYRGKGVFSAIGQKTHELARDNNYQFVIAILNNNSTSVFTNKLGFSFITPLSTRIGIDLPSIDVSGNLDNRYSRLWSEELLKWRFMNPANTYFYQQTKNGTYFLSKTQKNGIYSILTYIPANKDFKPPEYVQKLKSPVLTVWYGLNKEFRWKYYKHTSIPKILKPSPLNLVYHTFNDSLKQLQADYTTINPIDHDAY